jgi:hypothetical protein
MDASAIALGLSYSISSLGEIFRDKRTMVKRPEKAHLFFPNVGCTSTEIQTFEYIPLRFRTMRSPLAISVMEGTPLAFWSQETGSVHDFSSRPYSGGRGLRRLGRSRSVARPGHRSTS